MVMEKINVAQLLKDCPKGMELDCTMFDNVTFCCVKDNNKISINTPCGIIYLSKNGCYHSHDYAKCVIFPKGKTTWEGFVPPYKFKDGDVLFHSDSASNGIFIFKEILQRGNIQKVICYCDYDSEDGFCLGENHTCCWTDSKILHPATKEQRDILFRKMKEAGYKWNAETKILEKLIEPKFKVGNTITNGKTSITIGYIDDEYYYEISRNIANRLSIKNQDEWNLISEKFPNRFNINTLIPFESKVLVRAESGNLWKPAIFGCYMKDKYAPFYVLGGTSWKQCIPYEGNQHLLGKTTYCDEYFKTWK